MTHSLDEVLDARLKPIVDDAARLGVEVAGLRVDVDKLKDETDPEPDPVDPIPGKTTDLGLNLSHYRYTKHINTDPSSPTGYRVNSADFIALHEKFPVLRVMNHTAQMTAKRRNRTWANRITDS